MILAPSQYAALKTELQTDPTGVGYAAPLAAGSFSTLQALLNAAQTPSFWAWRTSVTKAEFTNSAGPEGTVFDWTGAGFITRSQGERDAWRELFSSIGDGALVVNPSLDNVRQAFADIFSGATAPAPANRTHLSAVARRLVTRVERLYAVGTGSTASPAKMGFEGPISVDDVIAAARS